MPEICGDEMSAGMTKFYRVACFNEIGGFVRQVMWDGIDCHRARMRGWIAESLDLEPLRFVHLRPQGTSQNGIWTGRLRAGFGQYFMGTSPLYYIAAALHRLPNHPVLIGSVALLWGYFRSWLKGLPRYDDLEFRRSSDPTGANQTSSSPQNGRKVRSPADPLSFVRLILTTTITHVRASENGPASAGAL